MADYLAHGNSTYYVENEKQLSIQNLDQLKNEWVRLEKHIRKFKIETDTKVQRAQEQQCIFFNHWDTKQFEQQNKT